MPHNPFITKDDWKKTKTKYFIPDKVVKSGSFGDKMDAIHKAFDKEGLDKLNKQKIPAAMKLIDEAAKLFDAWLNNAKALKDEAFNNKEKKDGKKNKTGAIERVKYFKGLLTDLENNCAATKDFFAGSRANYDKCLVLMKDALKDPSNSKALGELYSQGIRNYIGAPFHAAVTQYNGTDEVMKLLKEYEKVAANWNHLQGSGTAELAANPTERKKFLDEMVDAMTIGGKILKLTK